MPTIRCHKCDAVVEASAALPGVYLPTESLCLGCATEEAAPLVAAEADPFFQPTREIGERQRAVDVMKVAAAVAEKRIAYDAQRRLAVGGARP